MSNLSIRSIWRQAWAAFDRNWLTGIALFLLLVIIGPIPIAGTLFLLVTPVQWGLQVTRREKQISFTDAFSSTFSSHLKVLIGTFILFLIFLLSYLIFILIYSIITYLGFRTGFALYSILVALYAIFVILFTLGFQAVFLAYPYWIVDKGEGIFSSMRKSFAASTRKLGKLIVFVLSLIGVNFLGLLICGAGIFITIPLSWAAVAVLYQKLADQLEGESPSATS